MALCNTSAMSGDEYNRYVDANNRDIERNSQLRRNVRNFLLTATPEELQREYDLSVERGDELRARFVKELIDESENQAD